MNLYSPRLVKSSCIWMWYAAEFWAVSEYFTKLN